MLYKMVHSKDGGGGNDDSKKLEIKKLGIETTENWYSHVPKSVTEHEGMTVLWNQGVQTERFWQTARHNN
jgi:hypothetical protein